MTVTRPPIQVGSTDWAKSPAVVPTHRSRREAERQFVSSRPRQVDLALHYGVPVLVWHPGEVLGTRSGDTALPLGQTAHTLQMSRRRRLELGYHPVDGATHHPLYLHVPIDRDITETQGHVMRTGERPDGRRIPNQVVDINDQIRTHLRDVTEVFSNLRKYDPYMGPSASRMVGTNRLEKYRRR